MKVRIAGIVCIVVGIGLCAWVWYSALTNGRYDLKVAVLGPILIVLAAGFLVHGEAMPTTRPTLLLRVYGVGGSLLALVQLYLLGFFERGRLLEIGLGAFLIGAWFLPGRVFEQRAKPPAEPRPAPTSGSPQPIEPS